MVELGGKTTEPSCNAQVLSHQSTRSRDMWLDSTSKCKPKSQVKGERHQWIARCPTQGKSYTVSLLYYSAFFKNSFCRRLHLSIWTFWSQHLAWSHKTVFNRNPTTLLNWIKVHFPHIMSGPGLYSCRVTWKPIQWAPLAFLGHCP